MTAVWRPILDELFAGPVGANRKKLALWARVFGTVYESQLEGLGEWCALSGKTYRKVVRPARVGRVAGGRNITTDFRIERDGKYFAVEAKCQPSQNPGTIDGHVSEVLAFARGDSSTCRTFQTLV